MNNEHLKKEHSKLKKWHVKIRHVLKTTTLMMKVKCERHDAGW